MGIWKDVSDFSLVNTLWCEPRVAHTCLRFQMQISISYGYDVVWNAVYLNQM